MTPHSMPALRTATVCAMAAAAGGAVANIRHDQPMPGLVEGGLPAARECPERALYPGEPGLGWAGAARGGQWIGA